MEDHRTGQEETLMEVKVGMNGVAVSHLSRAQPRRSCFKCLLALATLLALVIGLMAALVVYFFIFAPHCNPNTPASHDTAKVQVNKLPGSNSQGTFDIFTANKSAEYFIYGWLRFPGTPGKDVTLSQTSMGQQKKISTQKANKTWMSFFERLKLVKGSKISITLCSSCTDSLFYMYEL